MNDLLRISFECQHCGGTILEVEDDFSDRSEVLCKGCGRSVGTFGNLKANAVKSALGSILNSVSQTLKK